MKDLLELCRDAVIRGDRDEARRLARRAVTEGLDLTEAITEGFARGMRAVGDRWGRGQAFLPDVAFSAEAMKAALDVLGVADPQRSRGPRVVVGTVAGDIHDIGKSLVAIMLAAHGYEVVDLGVDVSDDDFVAAARDARLVGMSALLTTTMPSQKRIVERLEREGLRGRVKVLIGGAPTSAGWARRIGADGYAENALAAVRVVDSLLGGGGAAA